MWLMVTRGSQSKRFLEINIWKIWNICSQGETNIWFCVVYKCGSVHCYIRHRIAWVLRAKHLRDRKSTGPSGFYFRFLEHTGSVVKLEEIRGTEEGGRSQDSYLLPVSFLWGVCACTHTHTRCVSSIYITVDDTGLSHRQDVCLLLLCVSVEWESKK